MTDHDLAATSALEPSIGPTRPLPTGPDAASDVLAAVQAVVAERSDGLVVCAHGPAGEPIVVHTSPAFASLAGQPAAAILGRPLSDFLQAEWPEAPWPSGSGEAEVATSTGTPMRVYARALTVTGPSGEELAAITVHRWQDPSHLSHAALRHAASHDSLTGLLNREAFSEIQHHRGTATGWAALILLDLDRFKLFNDTHGHDCGDDLLVAVANRIRSALTDDDLIARLGGDEFVVAARVATPADALAIADRIRLALINQPFRVGRYHRTITASIGVAVGEPSRSTRSLLRDADTALYSSKAEGRNRVRLFDEELRSTKIRRRELDVRLREALDHDALDVHYQPAWNLRTGGLQGAEALLRWPDGDVGPGELIPIAEESDLIERLGDRVLTTAIRQVRSWRRRSHPVRRVWVNISPNELTRPTFARRVLDALVEHGLDGPEVGLEVTEQCLRSDVDIAARQLAFLRAAGIGVGIDDFGTGYSSLAYITEFAPDHIKIDQSFIAALGHSSASRSIVATIVHLAHSVGAVALAEGVETHDQLAMLCELGCDAAAGFLLQAPVPAGDLAVQTPACLRELCGAPDRSPELPSG